MTEGGSLFHSRTATGTTKIYVVCEFVCLQWVTFQVSCKLGSIVLFIFLAEGDRDAIILICFSKKGCEAKYTIIFKKENIQMLSIENPAEERALLYFLDK